jgi:hypothetical protein
MKVTFTCKDPLIAAYCQREFGEKLKAKLEAADPLDDQHLKDQLVRFLTAEAQKQEWYDYEELGEPSDPQTTGRTAIRKRRVIFTDGIPKLLVPQVVIDRG